MITVLTSGPIWASTVWILLFIMTAYISIYYFIYLSQTKRWEQSNIPFLPPTFLIGNKHFLDSTKYSVTLPFDKLYKENDGKSLFGLFIGTFPLILLRDQKVIRQVFSKNLSQIRNVVALPQSEEVAQYKIGFTSSKRDWKLTRSKMMPIFSLNWFQGSRFEGIKEAICKLCRIAENSEATGSSINVTELTRSCVIDIGMSNFGIENHMQTMKNGLRTIVDDFFKPSYSRMLIFFSLSYFPSLQMFEYFKILSRKSCNIMTDTVNQLVKQRDQLNLEKGDFIDVLRSFKTDYESQNNWSKNSGVTSISKDDTMSQMSAMGITYIVGGSDTVYKLLTFAIHSLSLYPEYQSKIRTEVQETLKEHGVSELNFEVVRSLLFTFQCLFEALRLYPPAPLMMTQCLEDFRISGANCIFRKGDKVAVPLYSVARDEVQFPEPNSFNPERFKFKGNSLAIPETFLNFGVGSRKCPGFAHGMFVAAALLSSLVHKYDIKPRSHLKLMDATDFNPKGFSNAPRRDVYVDLVRCENS